jgi:hypothetical protein
MGIREKAIEAQDQEAGRNVPEYKPKIYSGGQIESSLFGDPSDIDYWPNESKGKVRAKDFSKEKPGTMTIEMKIPIKDLGECGDPESPKWDFNKMLDVAEQAALDILEDLAGADVTERFELTMTSDEDLDDVVVQATLIPTKGAH